MWKRFSTVLLLLTICIKTVPQKVDSSKLYALIGGCASTMHQSTYGANLNIGLRGGKRVPPIGFGIDVLKPTRLRKVYTPIYINVQPFYKQFFATFQFGHVPYNDPGATPRTQSYKGGVYIGAGIGALFLNRKVTPYASLRFVRLPLYLGDKSLSESGLMFTLGMKI